MTKESKKEKLQGIIKDLFATDEVIVLDALDKLREEGDPSVIIPLLRVYKDWDAPDVREAVRKLMYEIKVEAVSDELIRSLDNPEFASLRAFIVSVFWNAGIFPSSDLHTLVKTAINNDYNVVLEVLTVVENMEGPFDEEQLTNSIFDLQDEIDENPEGVKHDLLKSLYEVLIEFQNNQ